jgi:hypothetical protein
VAIILLLRVSQREGVIMKNALEFLCQEKKTHLKHCCHPYNTYTMILTQHKLIVKTGLSSWTGQKELD